eukprot:02437.XXX_45665_46179_1 [CDS] Oithona nana genome sequencing.
MPTYDLSLIVKHAIKRPEVVSAVKRLSEGIIDHGGYVRKLEYVGNRALPQRTQSGGQWHYRGNYFVLRVDIPVPEVAKITEMAAFDLNIIRKDLVSVTPPKEAVCTLEEEMRPPSERPSVQAMIEIGRKKPKYRRIYKPNTGLSYDPLYR